MEKLNNSNQYVQELNEATQEMIIKDLELMYKMEGIDYMPLEQVIEEALNGRLSDLSDSINIYQYMEVDNEPDRAMIAYGYTEDDYNNDLQAYLNIKEMSIDLYHNDVLYHKVKMDKATMKEIIEEHLMLEDEIIEHDEAQWLDEIIGMLQRHLPITLNRKL